MSEKVVVGSAVPAQGQVGVVPQLDIAAPDVDLKAKLEEMQKAEDEAFMKAYQDVSVDDLITKNFLVHEAEIMKGFNVKIRTLRKSEELDVKRRVSEYDGAQMYVVDQLNVDALTYSLMEINGSPLPEVPEKFDDAKKLISDLPDAVVVAILEEYRNLNKALVILMRGSSKNSLARLLLGRESA